MSTKKEVAERKRKEKLEREHKIIDGIDYKICNKHHMFFPNEDPWLPATTEFFYCHKQNKTDGFYPECKRCGIAKSWENQKGNMERHNAHQRRYYHEKEKRKNDLKEISNRRRKEGKHLAWQRTESGKQSAKKSMQKRKLKEHLLYPIEWENTKKYFDNKCCYCGLPIKEHYITRLGIKKLGDFHKDHAIDDGRNDIKNTLPSCDSCNTSKHTSTLNAWYNPNNPKYSRERYLKIVQWLRYDCKKYIMPKRRYKRQSLKARLKEIEENKSK